MSEQAVAALLERLQTDRGFRERLEAAATPEAKRQVVKDAGFDISRSDLPFLRVQVGLQELSDEDLDKVAGGGAFTLSGLRGGAAGAIGAAAAAAT